MDRSKEYGTLSDPWSQVHSTDEGIVQSMTIDGAPWEYYHHRPHLPDYHKDYSNDPSHPSVFDFLSNTVNTVDYEDSSFTKSTSLKNETSPFPNRVFDYNLVKSKSSPSKISKGNLHPNHRVERNEGWGACTLISVIMLGACKLITSSVTTGLKLVKK